MKKSIVTLFLCGLSIFNFGQTNHDSIFLFVQKQPEFKGGLDSLNKYLYTSIDYPVSIITDSIEGIVYVGFVVNLDGSLINVELLRGLGEKFDQEAVRVVREMPAWIPAEHDGRVVREKTNLPVKFVLPSSQPDTTKIYYEADRMPEFPGGLEALFQYLQDSVRFPEDFDDQLMHIAIVDFVVERNGIVSNAEVSEGCHISCNAEAVRLVSAMPKLSPGLINKLPVKIALNLPVTFDRPGEVFTVVEDMPEFPGGMHQLMMFLATNIKYPAKAKNKGIQGRVFINFVVEPDGSVSNVKVLQGIGGGCDEEAVRVVKLMPKWIPGKQKEEPVKVSFTLPVKFNQKNSSRLCLGV